MASVDKLNKKTTALALKIRRARLAAGLSQSRLGSAIGLSDKSVSAYEKGRAVPPLDKLRKIAGETRQSLNYFLSDNGAPDVTLRLVKMEKELREIKRLLKREKADSRN